MTTSAILTLQQPAPDTASVFFAARWRRAARRASRAQRRLRDALEQRGTVALGTAAAPFAPVGQNARLWRWLLHDLESRPGVTCRLTSNSPALIDDLETLARLDRRHAIDFEVPVSTLDERRQRLLDPRAPSPASRLDLLRRAGEHGLRTRLAVPIAAGVNDDPATLQALFTAARRHGATDVVLAPAAGRPAGLGIAATARRLRLEHGFPRARPGRG